MFTEEKKNFQISQDSDNVYKPADEIETSNFIKEIYKKNLPTEIVGTNTKNFIGNKLQCAKVLDLSRLSGIVEYLPEELYIKVKACTPISLIEEFLEKNYQQLAFEPFDFEYLKDSKSIPQSWKEFFDGLGEDQEIVKKEILGPSWSPAKNNNLEILKILNLKNSIKLTKVNSDYFSKVFFAKRPNSENLLNKQLNKKGLNLMRPWRDALKEYLEKSYSSYL